ATGGNGGIYLGVAGLHAQANFEVVFEVEVFKVEFLSRADADAGKLRANLLFFRRGGSELQGEVEILEKVRLDRVLVNRREVDGWRRGRRGLMQIRRERLHVVAVLNLDHVRHVVRVEKLRAIDRHRELC